MSVDIQEQSFGAICMLNNTLNAGPKAIKHCILSDTEGKTLSFPGSLLLLAYVLVSVGCIPCRII